MVRAVVGRALATAYVLAQLPRERRVLSATLAQILARRDARLRRLVRVAATTVPHYRDVFAEERIDWREVRSADDLRHLPLLDKGSVRAAPERFVAESWRGRSAVPLVTSGTTGARLTVHHDVLSLLANYAQTAPEKAVARRLAGPGPIARQMTILYAATTVRSIWKVYRAHSFIPSPAGHHFVDVTTPVDEVIRSINEHRPDLLMSYGSYLDALFRLVVARRIELHRPRLVRYGGDAMPEDGRRLVERHLGIPVQAGYNAVEQLRLGFTCERQSGYHLREDLCALWLRDDAGRPTRPGTPGELVISNLMNRGTVLLNYRLGDEAVASDEPCACGCALRRLVRLEGRVEDVLRLADGRLVHPRAVWAVLKDRPEILRYQLVQEEPTRFSLKLATNGRAVFDAMTGGIERDMLELLGPGRLDLEHWSDLGAPPTGKFRPVVSRCHGAGRA